jgi:hypothetical protein
MSAKDLAFQKRWAITAAWYNEEVDRLLNEGLSPAQFQEPSSQSLLIHNILAGHLKDFAFDRLLLEAACKVFITARIPEKLITVTIQAFLLEYLPDAQNN